MLEAWDIDLAIDVLANYFAKESENFASFLNLRPSN